MPQDSCSCDGDSPLLKGALQLEHAPALEVQEGRKEFSVKRSTERRCTREVAMPLVNAAAFVLLAAALLGQVSGTAYRAGWHPRPSLRAPTPSTENAEPSGNAALWISPRADPKPPKGWFRMVELLDQTSAHVAKQGHRAVSSIDRTPLTIREALLEITVGKLNPAPLSITYDDMHGLWGGLTLTIRGDGNVEQKAVKEEAGTPSLVSRDSILKLVRLLLKEKAWEQREPQRAAKSDESRARLVIQYGEQRSEIWEWYNDLDKTQRLGKVRALMKKIASK